ncbi:hypothetical protein [Sphingomonas sp. G-3-2-10]|uniref:hypothetical protein n=1 Tax=Sphingomonas sp. G-3-2-10 TaxID=2728838 RepID=UPI00146E741D|nr:hypothetical protein [Sphingomonas sp. G-3-2-10]NML05031.1 hypothetical protein [Sphingomonas sp. G-3-2-10]
MEVDAPKAPFPLKQLLRESLSQIALGLVWFAGIFPVNMIFDVLVRGTDYGQRWIWITMAMSAGMLLLAAPVLILDHRKQRCEKSLARP